MNDILFNFVSLNYNQTNDLKTEIPVNAQLFFCQNSFPRKKRASPIPIYIFVADNACEQA